MHLVKKKPKKPLSILDGVKSRPPAHVGEEEERRKFACKHTVKCTVTSNITEEADGKRSDGTSASRRSAMQRRRFRSSQGNMFDFIAFPLSWRTQIMSKRSSSGLPGTRNDVRNFLLPFLRGRDISFGYRCMLTM